MIYGSREIEEEHGLIGLVISSIYQKGEVSNIVYCSPDEPLYLVPKSFFVVNRNSPELVGLSNSQILKRTRIFRTGENVEFGAGENGIVKWALKTPNVLDIEHTEGKFIVMAVSGILQKKFKLKPFYVETAGLLSPYELRFWTKKFGYLCSSDEEIRQWSSATQPDVTVKIKVRIEVDYGEHEHSEFLLGSFKPHSRYYLDSIVKGECSADLKLIAPWNCSPQEKELPQKVNKISRDDDPPQEGTTIAHTDLKPVETSNSPVVVFRNEELQVQQQTPSVEDLSTDIAKRVEEGVKGQVAPRKFRLFKPTMNLFSSKRL